MSFFFLNSTFAQSPDVGQVVATSEIEIKGNAPQKAKVIVAFKTSLDSFGLDWNFYGVKRGEGLAEKFNKSMMDWFLINKIANVDELVLIDEENSNPEYTHLLQWNLFVRKITVQGKIQQFELSFDFFVAQKKNTVEPFYRGMHEPEIRTFPADLIKQVPDILQKSLVNLSVPQWQKVRQTLIAMQNVQERMQVTVKNYTNILNLLNLIDHWKETGRNIELDAKLDKFDQGDGSVTILYRGTLASAMKVLTAALPVDQNRFPFKLTIESKNENLIFNLN